MKQHEITDSPTTTAPGFAGYAIGRLILSEMERQELRRADLARRIGNNAPKILRRFDNLLQTGNGPVILSRLVDALGIEPEALQVARRETEAELQAERGDAERRREQFHRDHFKSHVVVETDCHTFRTPGPLTNMICRAAKRIELPAELEQMLLWDRVDEVGRIVKRHFDRHTGVLGAYGRIHGYVFRRTYDDAISFATTGLVSNYFAVPPVETRPSLDVIEARAKAPALEDAAP